MIFLLITLVSLFHTSFCPSFSTLFLVGRGLNGQPRLLLTVTIKMVAETNFYEYLIRKVLFEFSNTLTPIGTCFLRNQLYIQKCSLPWTIQMPRSSSSDDTRRNVGYDILQDEKTKNIISDCISGLFSFKLNFGTNIVITNYIFLYE